MFQEGVVPDQLEYVRDAERYRTIDEIIHLDYEDMEAFYD